MFKINWNETIKTHLHLRVWLPLDFSISLCMYVWNQSKWDERVERQKVLNVHKSSYQIFHWEELSIESNPIQTRMAVVKKILNEKTRERREWGIDKNLTWQSRTTRIDLEGGNERKEMNRFSHTFNYLPQSSIKWFNQLFIVIENTVKLVYNEQLGTGHFCSLWPGFVIIGLICVLKWPIWLQKTTCSLITEFVITDFHCKYLKTREKYKLELYVIFF